MRSIFLVFALTAPLIAWAQPDSQSMLERVRTCYDAASSQRFDALREVFPLGSASVSEQMLAARTVPTPVQREALRLYRAAVLGCARSAIDRDGPIERNAVLARQAEDLRLDLLGAGRMTFADYAVLQHADSMKTEFWIDQLKQAINAPRPLTGLVCTIESGAVTGLELLVQFDEASNRVYVNRGGAIKRNWIDSASIGYEQDSGTFSISRVSGRIMWSGSGVGVIGMGQCRTGATQKF